MFQQFFLWIFKADFISSTSGRTGEPRKGVSGLHLQTHTHRCTQAHIGLKHKGMTGHNLHTTSYTCVSITYAHTPSRHGDDSYLDGAENFLPFQKVFLAWAKRD